MTGQRLDRRRTLRLSGLALAGLLAGCSSPGGGGEDGEDGEEDGEDGDGGEEGEDDEGGGGYGGALSEPRS